MVICSYHEGWLPPCIKYSFLVLNMAALLMPTALSGAIGVPGVHHSLVRTGTRCVLHHLVWCQCGGNGTQSQHPRLPVYSNVVMKIGQYLLILPTYVRHQLATISSILPVN